MKEIDLIKFVLRNRKDKCFIDCSIYRIAYMIREGLQNGTCYYAVGQDNTIIGMILAIKDEVRKVLFVVENMCMSLHTMKLFYRKAHLMYPEYTFEGLKHNKPILYNNRVKQYNAQFLNKRFL